MQTLTRLVDFLMGGDYIDTCLSCIMGHGNVPVARQAVLSKRKACLAILQNHADFLSLPRELTLTAQYPMS